MRCLFITLAIVATLFIAGLAVAQQYNHGYGGSVAGCGYGYGYGMMRGYTGANTGYPNCLNTYYMRGQVPGNINFQSEKNASRVSPNFH